MKVDDNLYGNHILGGLFSFTTYYFQDSNVHKGIDTNIDILQASHKSMDSYHGLGKRFKRRLSHVGSYNVELHFM